MKKTKSLLLSTPYLVWMVVFTLIPLGVVAYYALTDPATGAFSLGNVKSLGMYLPVLWKSIGYSLVSAFICLLLGYPVAYYIAHRSPTASRITSKAALAASALISSCGKNKVFFSKPLPTKSSAGIIYLLITSKGFSLSKATAAALRAASANPFTMAS